MAKIKTLSELMTDLCFTKIKHKSKISGKYHVTDIDINLLPLQAKVVGGIVMVTANGNQWQKLGEVA